MIFGKNWRGHSVRHVLLCGLFCFAINTAETAFRASIAGPERAGNPRCRQRKRLRRRTIRFILVPAKDLALQPENARKADALVDFVEGSRLEENAEMDNALAAYQKVLNFDPGQVELALRVAALLSRPGGFSARD